MTRKTDRPLVGPGGEIDDEVKRWAQDLAKKGKKMSGEDPYVRENCFVSKETDKALLVTDITEEEEFWVPKSVVHDDSEVYKKGQRGKLVVEHWFAKKEGWTED